MNDFVDMEEKDNNNDFERLSSEPKLFEQEVLTDLIRNVNLSKLLASRRKDKNLIKEGNKVTF